MDKNTERKKRAIDDENLDLVTGGKDEKKYCDCVRPELGADGKCTKCGGIRLISKNNTLHG